VDEELTPTPADQWPKNVAQTVTLPSGGVAQLRRPDGFNLIRQNKVPPKVASVMNKRQSGKTVTEADALAYIEFLISASFVKPEVTFTREAGKLCIRDISDEDKGAIITVLGLVM
jgi:hypothetical protein